MTSKIPPLPRVVFFNRSYWPDVEATGQLLTELTEDLADDFSIEVVVGQPNSLNSRDAFQQAGIEQRAGVTIRRLKHAKFSKHSLLGRLLNLLSFTWAAAWSSLTLPKPQIVVTETDPFFLAFVGQWLQFRHGCRLVVYLQDIYPDIAVAVGKLREGIVTRIVRLLLFRVYRTADRVVVLSRDMEQTCLKYGVPKDKLRIIPNWADTKLLTPHKSGNLFRQLHGLEDKFLVMYSGNLGLAHPLAPIIDAAEALRNLSHVRFVFVGDGARRRELEADVARRHLSNVLFLPYQPRDQLAQSLSAADVHLVTMQPEATGCLMPSKLYGILASGSAIVVMADPTSELAELVEQHDLGFICDLRNLADAGERLAFVVNFLAERPEQVRVLGANARELAESQFDRSLQTAAFGQLLTELAMAPDREPASGSAPQMMSARLEIEA